MIQLTGEHVMKLIDGEDKMNELEQIYEAVAGEGAIDGYTHEEILLLI